jgi:hypothetical protein
MLQILAHEASVNVCRAFKEENVSRLPITDGHQGQNHMPLGMYEILPSLISSQWYPQQHLVSVADKCRSSIPNTYRCLLVTVLEHSVQHFHSFPLRMGDVVFSAWAGHNAGRGRPATAAAVGVTLAGGGTSGPPRHALARHASPGGGSEALCNHTGALES